MSRSYRKTPATGITTRRSEKHDKQLWHRRYRQRNRERVKAGMEPADIREISDPWVMGKDGKKYWGERHPLSRNLRRK
jgi:hypothetical protein